MSVSPQVPMRKSRQLGGRRGPQAETKCRPRTFMLLPRRFVHRDREGLSVSDLHEITVEFPLILEYI